MNSRFLLLQACVLVAGIAAFSAATDGFRVLTTEGARRIAIAEAPQVIPNVPMVDQNGRRFTFADYRGRTVLVEFIYTRCPVICGLLGEGFAALQERLQNGSGRISLLSISFDPTHDDVAALKSYGERFGAEAPLWRIAAPSPAEVRTLLESFGVVVISDQFGGYTHNAAISVLDADGRLVQVIDPGSAPRLLEQVRSRP